jgi:hypothetical protein
MEYPTSQLCLYIKFSCKPLALSFGPSFMADHHLPMMGDNVDIMVGGPADHQLMLTRHGSNNWQRLHHRLSDGFHDLHLLCRGLLLITLYYNRSFP